MSTAIVITWEECTLKVYKQLRKLMGQIQGTLPKDAVDRPLGLVDATKLLELKSNVAATDLINNVPPEIILPNDYSEGVPTIQGRPIWEKLSSEPVDQYNLFKAYRELQDNKQKRSLYKLSLLHGTSLATLELIRRVNHWNVRTQAYDEYLDAEHMYIVERSQRELESRHHKTAKDLFDKCSEVALDRVEVMSNKDLLEWTKMALELERISLGLKPNSPGTAKEGSGNFPVININNNANNGQVNTKTAGGTGVTGDLSEDRDRLAKILNVMDKIGVLTPNEKDNAITVEAKALTEEEAIEQTKQEVQEVYDGISIDIEDLDKLDM